MNNLEAALNNVKSILEELEVKWPRPRSEAEQIILDKLLATGFQLGAIQKEYTPFQEKLRRLENPQ